MPLEGGGNWGIYPPTPMGHWLRTAPGRRVFTAQNLLSALGKGQMGYSGQGTGSGEELQVLAVGSLRISTLKKGQCWRGVGGWVGGEQEAHECSQHLVLISCKL